MMKIFLKFKIIGLVLILGVLAASCEKASQDASPIVPPNDTYPTVTLKLNTATTITEGDTAVYTISLNKPISSSLTFVPVIDTAATDLVYGTDYEFGSDVTGFDPADPSFTIPAYDTTVSFMVITYRNIAADPTRNLTFNVVDNVIGEKYLIQPGNDFNKISLSVENYVSPNLTLDFMWSTAVVIGGSTYDAADYVDFDFYIADAAGFDIANPWPNTYGIYDAATGSYPEELVITPGELADGDYVIFANLYSNGFYGAGATTPIPAETWAYRAGTTFNVPNIAEDPAGVIDASTPGYNETGSDYNGIMVKLTIAGSTFSVYDYAGTLIGSTKSASADSKIIVKAGQVSVTDGKRPVLNKKAIPSLKR